MRRAAVAPEKEIIPLAAETQDSNMPAHQPNVVFERLSDGWIGSVD